VFSRDIWPWSTLPAHCLGQNSRFAIWTKYDTLGQFLGHDLLCILLLSCIYCPRRHLDSSDSLCCDYSMVGVAMMISKLTDKLSVRAEPRRTMTQDRDTHVFVASSRHSKTHHDKTSSIPVEFLLSEWTQSCVCFRIELGDLVVIDKYNILWL
jgi:hypothetical protein